LVSQTALSAINLSALPSVKQLGRLNYLIREKLATKEMFAQKTGEVAKHQHSLGI
jgi:hypothetical protein